MTIQDQYEEQLRGYSGMITSDLVPKMGILDGMFKRLSDDNQALAKDEPILGFLFNAVKLDVFLSIAKLLDGKRSDRNVQRFIAFCETHRTKIQWKSGEIPLKIIRRHQSLLSANETVIKKFTARRDKYLAHTDKEYFLDAEKLEADFPLTRTEIVGLIQCFQTIICDHTMGMTGTMLMSMGDIYEATTDNLITRFIQGKAKGHH